MGRTVSEPTLFDEVEPLPMTPAMPARKSRPGEEPEPAPVLVGATRSREDGPEPDGARAYVELASAPTPAYVAPPEPYLQTPLTPNLGDLSYVEDESQRQLYRVRNLATLVAVVVLVIAFVWALGEGLGALGDWWDEFFGNLRL